MSKIRQFTQADQEAIASFEKAIKIDIRLRDLCGRLGPIYGMEDRALQRGCGFYRASHLHSHWLISVRKF